MKIAFYYPNSLNDYMRLFCKFVENHKFTFNTCSDDVDLIYCASVSVLHNALEAKIKYNKPLICWVWDIPFSWETWARTSQEHYTNRNRTEIIKGQTEGLKQCNLVISSSKYTQKVLKELYNIDSVQTYFYIDTDGLDKVRVAKKKNQIIQISRFTLHKRFDIAISAFNCGVLKNYTFAAVGYGEYENLVRTSSPNVKFYVNYGRDKTISLLKESEVLVSPSIFEGWGITPIEALYCGIPVLLNDLEVFREMYGDIVPYHKKDDVLDMREKLCSLLGDKDAQRRMIELCKPIVNDLTPLNFAKRWNDIVTNI